MFFWLLPLDSILTLSSSMAFALVGLPLLLFLGCHLTSSRPLVDGNQFATRSTLAPRRSNSSSFLALGRASSQKSEDDWFGGLPRDRRSTACSWAVDDLQTVASTAGLPGGELAGEVEPGLDLFSLTLLWPVLCQPFAFCLSRVVSFVGSARASFRSVIHRLQPLVLRNHLFSWALSHCPVPHVVHARFDFRET